MDDGWFDSHETFEEKGGMEVRVLVSIPGGTMCNVCQTKFIDSDVAKTEALMWNGVPTVTYAHVQCPDIKR